MSTDPRTAREIARLLAEENPIHRFAVNKAETIIGCLPPGAEPGAYVPHLGLTLLKTWAPMPTVLVNGKPLVTDWIPVPIDNPKEKEKNEQ